MKQNLADQTCELQSLKLHNTTTREQLRQYCRSVQTNPWAQMFLYNSWTDSSCCMF